MWKVGLEKSKIESAVFYKKKQNELCGILIVHVDDFLFGGNSKFLACTEKLKRELFIGTHFKPISSFAEWKSRAKQMGYFKSE